MTLRRKLIWIAILYFAEGFPFGIVIDNLPVYFRTHGVSLTQIGLMSLLGLPWTLKVFWSPLVDRLGQRRHWITLSLLVMAAVLVLVPIFDPSSPDRRLWTILLVFTIASATQDIAIDAYSIGLLSKGEEGVGNGIRVSAYRVALIVGGGGLVMAAELVSWQSLYRATAIAFVGLALLVRKAPPVFVKSEPISDWLRAFSTWLRQPNSAFVLAFVLIYKLGDMAMGPMVKPFWVDRGLTLKEIGLISTTLGVGASIVGSLLGGLLTSRWGIFHALWSLGLLQALSNLGYAATAYYDGGRAAIYAASLLESFTGGLGTAAFLAFLMRICEKERAATEYALLSAIFGLARSVSGAFSGWGASRFGYASYFSATFLLALPAFALLPWVRSWVKEDSEQTDARSQPPGQSVSRFEGGGAEIVRDA